MKKHIKKLLYSSLIAFMSIGINFDTEARVTREVAEATLPYLMEAAGIPQDIRPNPDPNPNVPYYSQVKRDAIISMIYTDAGQREMVDWVKSGKFPQRLTTDPITQQVIFISDNLYLDGWLRMPLQQTNPQAQNIDILTQNLMAHVPVPSMLSYAIQAIRDAYIGALFPCGPGTFSSFAAHPSRLGYHTLENGGGNLERICAALIQSALQVPNIPGAQDIINRLRQYQNIDNQLANVLFVLDICDTVTQIKNILNLILPADANRDGNIDAIIAGAILVNEYSYRPVSATTFPKTRQGDCVETLYRHLVNIAIQNDITAPKNFNVGHLLEAFKRHYYGPIYIQNYTKPNRTTPNPQHNPILPTIITTINGESGLMQLRYHGYWRDALSEVPNIGNFSNATITDIVEVLRKVSPANMGQSNLRMHAAAGGDYQAPLLVPVIQTSPNQQANATTIQNALNALDGRCNVGNERFIVNVTDNPNVIGAQANLPNGINIIIEIADKLWNRTIKVGIWTDKHAEIVNIQ